MRAKIYKTLRDYRMTNMCFEEGDNYCLVDLMTRDGESIADGENEMEYLADEIASSIDVDREKLHRRAQQAERAHAIIKGEIEYFTKSLTWAISSKRDFWFTRYLLRKLLRKVERLELSPPKAYRFIPKYAAEEQKADPQCWSVMITKPAQNWIDWFIVEELR